MEDIATSVLSQALVDFGYHVIDNFLNHDNYRELYNQIQTLASSGIFRPAKVGHAIHTTHHPQIRTDNICWLDNTTQTPALFAFYEAIDSLKQTLNRTLFIGLDQFEAHFSIYYPGQFYKKHVDQFKDNNDRRISCVYYLNEDWQSPHGGELSLYDAQQECMTTLAPLKNRLVFFNSSLLHEVHTTHQIRYSITGWLKSRALYG